MKSEKVMYRGLVYYMYFSGTNSIGKHQPILASKLEDVGKKGFFLKLDEYMEVVTLQELRNEKINQLLGVENK
jgi:hypothetical protein